MSKSMLIDATHPEETRVAIINGNRLEEYDVEIASRKPLKGNIYVARIIRIEPSLQAAFVDYGGNRHGFLPLNEIHPDYFRIPVADRQKLQELQEKENAYLMAQEEAEEAELQKAETSPEEAADSEIIPEEDSGHLSEITEISGEEKEDDSEISAKEDGSSPRGELTKFLRSYRIQEVLRPRQVVLVQVTKEERGNKGAALSTFLSLPGRYSVLMPNTLHGGGISRKISSREDRKRLRNLIEQFELPSCMGMIIRTAGSGQPDSEIRRDCDYLRQLWEKLRLLALESEAPVQIHEEGNLLKRALRDLLSPDISEIIVDGKDAFRVMRNYAANLLSQNAPELRSWNGRKESLFSHFHVDDHIHSMVSPTVQLESGGYIVINQTEALVAIDVNSGKSTSQRNIEETALRTNLEAAEEIARQLRLRDLAGLIVIDFIDMTKNRHNTQVERKLREALKVDRARLQVGNISGFGLLEMSRQRLRPSLSETLSSPCPHCEGTGRLRSIESLTLRALRILDREAAAKGGSRLLVTLPTEVAIYLLNHKRDNLRQIEQRHNLKIICATDQSFTAGAIQIEGQDASESAPSKSESKSEEDYAHKRNGRNQNQRPRSRQDRHDRQDRRHEHRHPESRYTDSNLHKEDDSYRKDAETDDAPLSAKPNSAESNAEASSGDEGKKGGRKPQRKTRSRSVSSQKKRRQKLSDNTEKESETSSLQDDSFEAENNAESDFEGAKESLEAPKEKESETGASNRRRRGRRTSSSKQAAPAESAHENIHAENMPAAESVSQPVFEAKPAPEPVEPVVQAPPKPKQPENLNAPKAVNIDSVTEKKEWKNPWQKTAK